MKEIYKYLLIFVGSMFVFPALSHAECSYERQAELSRIAGNVQASYTYEIIDSEPIFTVNVSNVSNDIYIEDKKKGRFFGDFNKSYTHGQSIGFSIYSNDGNCPNELLLQKYITLPSFNDISTYPECKQYPEFKYCQTWINVSDQLTEEQFHNLLNESNKKNKTIKEQEKTSIWEVLKTTVEDNKTILSLIVVAILILIIIFYLKKRRSI